ncbi:MAG: TRAP transporter large permease subunit, partial [Dehalococcoidia bacterium]|nr:TRAP transporter large permease subunit [Dehalococcoidia bacterium]
FSSVTGQSVGRMYLACFVPGFTLAVLYMLYIGVRCYLRPAMGPPAPPETRAGWGTKIAKLRGVLMPVALLLSMLVGIYSGAVTPMEASAVGVAGAFVCAAIKRRLSWAVVWEAVFMTLRITCMIGWLFLAIGCFTAVYAGIGAMDLAQHIAAAVPGGGMPVIIVMQFVLIIFGMFMDDVAIIMIFGPIFFGIVKSLGFDTLWYGVLFMVNIQLAFLTPPYGFGLFAMRAVLPTIPELKPYNISMGDIYRAAVPFIGLQVLALALIIIFQPLATFLPSLLIR